MDVFLGWLTGNFDVIFFVTLLGSGFLLQAWDHMKESAPPNEITEFVDDGGECASPWVWSPSPFARDNFAHYDFAKFDTWRDADTTNPGTGLPMAGCLDVGGNPYGGCDHNGSYASARSPGFVELVAENMA